MTSLAMNEKILSNQSQINDDLYPPVILSWTIWGLGALLYAIGFFQRTAPAVMTTELMADFHITASALGHLASFFFYAYALMQIPTGILTGL